MQEVTGSIPVFSTKQSTLQKTFCSVLFVCIQGPSPAAFLGQDVPFYFGHSCCIGFLGYVLPFYAKNGIGFDPTPTFIIEPTFDKEPTLLINLFYKKECAEQNTRRIFWRFGPDLNW